MTALPANEFLARTAEHTAYTRCLQLEEHASSLENDGLSPLVCARILGYLLVYAPTDSGRANVASEINDCRGDTRMMQLAEVYSNSFIRCFKRIKGPTPAPSDHPSRPSFDNAREGLSRALTKPPEGHSSAKTQALERDNFRCAITGEVDSDSFDSGTVDVPDHNLRLTITQAAHIFPPSTNKNIIAGSDKLEYSTAVWTVMRRFGGVKVEDELNGNKIHRLENIITMDSTIHGFFDELKIWLEPVAGQPNTYQPKARHQGYLSRALSRVTFRSNESSLPPPEPRYIALHAACAKVAYMSGAAEYFDIIMRDMDEIKVLADDGSSGGLLAHALRLYVTAAA